MILKGYDQERSIMPGFFVLFMMSVHSDCCNTIFPAGGTKLAINNNVQLILSSTGNTENWVSCSSPADNDLCPLCMCMCIYTCEYHFLYLQRIQHNAWRHFPTNLHKLNPPMKSGLNHKAFSLSVALLTMSSVQIRRDLYKS